MDNFHVFLPRYDKKMELLPLELRFHVILLWYQLTNNYTSYMNLILNLWYCLVEIIKDEEERYELFVSKNRSLIWICFKKYLKLLEK